MIILIPPEAGDLLLIMETQILKRNCQKFPRQANRSSFLRKNMSVVLLIKRPLSQVSDHMSILEVGLVLAMSSYILCEISFGNLGSPLKNLEHLIYSLLQLLNLSH